jgi:geranylgeranylglycerol-phosphate geranylgeranyltransferase
MHLHALPKITLRQKMSGLVRIFRPELPFAAGVCVVVGEILAFGAFPPIHILLLGFLCGFFLSSTALILNDYFDLEVDRINAPHRPLPSGIVTKTEVLALSILTSLLGLGAGLALGPVEFILSVFFWMVGVAYNWRFKQAGLVGNLMVSSSVAITFILGAIAVGDPWNPVVWVFSLIAFGINLGEEIAGDAMDIDGDRKRGSKSIGILKGREFALRVSAGLFSLVVVVSLIPVLAGWLGASYLVMILITDSMIVLFTFRLLQSRTPEEGRRAMRGIYMGALVGLLAFIAGQWIV